MIKNITKNYIGEMCGEEYKPTRRGVQKFCNSKCTNKASYHKNKLKKANNSRSTEENQTNEKKNLEENTPFKMGEEKKKKELKLRTKNQMSFATVGEAASGVFIIQLLTKLLTKVDNKQATKGDIEELKNLILENKERYLEITNIPQDPFRSKPYYDRLTKTVVYSGIETNDPTHGVI